MVNFEFGQKRILHIFHFMSCPGNTGNASHTVHYKINNILFNNKQWATAKK